MVDKAVVAERIMLAIENGTGITIGSNGETPTTGYMVSRHGAELRMHRNRLTRTIARAWIGTLILGPGSFYGAWIDGENVYLDVSDHYAGLDCALGVARENNQIAIWDVAKGEEIRLQP